MKKEREIQVVGALKHRNTKMNILRFIVDGTEYSSNITERFIQLLVQKIRDQPPFHLHCSAVEVTTA
jgi:hypothetical protein